MKDFLKNSKYVFLVFAFILVHATTVILIPQMISDKSWIMPAVGILLGLLIFYTDIQFAIYLVWVIKSKLQKLEVLLKVTEYSS